MVHVGDDGQISDVLPGIDAHNFSSHCSLSPGGLESKPVKLTRSFGSCEIFLEKIQKVFAGWDDLSIQNVASDAGRILNTRSSSRQIQLGLRLIF
jgi:hypothetical protein